MGYPLKTYLSRKKKRRSMFTLSYKVWSDGVSLRACCHEYIIDSPKLFSIHKLDIICVCVCVCVCVCACVRACMLACVFHRISMQIMWTGKSSTMAAMSTEGYHFPELQISMYAYLWKVIKTILTNICTPFPLYPISRQLLCKL
jgi:hypothetical protein